MRNRRLITAAAAACTVAALAAGSALGTPAGHPPAPARSATEVSAAHPAAGKSGTPAGVQLQGWLYPGSAGEPQCAGQAEYADDRLKTGALSPEYWAVQPNGTLLLETTAQGLCNAYSAANVADLKAHSAAQYPTVSAMDTATVRALVGSSVRRGQAVQQLTAMTVNAGLTGIDVDMEDYWSWAPADFTGYRTFLTELATSLHSAGKRLQVDAPAMTEDASWYDYAAVAATGVDEIAIMAYDDEYASDPGGKCKAITPYAWLKQVVQYAQSKVPDHDRLVIGLPSYGYSAPAACDTSAITGNIPFSVMRGNPGWSGNAATIERRRDSGSGEIRWTSGGRLYDYVDRTAMDRKLKVLTGLGVTKVSVWSLGGNPWFTR
ncbi:glycosyl hydrolase family 18 protein [Streptomyces sp. H10-C2]|uniref:glycosyl hydrolase family 18 protein n=1 Tax=unclassified Streptomyces TaxID=2593676 RepID=UPI0024B9EB32|nr:MULTISPECIES: glycosyl hydrolase family 18 protein [unclassified Streptomyces]MDJ0346893.1 glycosyl hydrolase family 18 protein [Streptomyces sp. PH10-H1]MDJ0370685.1 glycosyl hydrolase family 18 protein [Streptomyces sp. H10-C2]